METKITMRMLALAACLLAGLGGKAEDSQFSCNSYLTIDQNFLRSLPIGEEREVTVYLHRRDNYEGITNGSIYIDLPEGLEVTYAEFDEDDVWALNARGEKFNPFGDPSYDTVDGQCRLIWNDITQTPFTQHDCRFLRLWFKKTSQLAPGALISVSKFNYMIPTDNTDNIECVNEPLILAYGSILIDGLYYNILSNNTVELAYSNQSGDLVIPRQVNYNGAVYNVVSIGDNAFSNCSSLTSLTIPEDVTSISPTAFVGCDSLTSIIWNAKACNDFTEYYYRPEGSPVVLLDENSSSVIEKTTKTKTTNVHSRLGNENYTINTNGTPFYPIRESIKSFTFGDSVTHIPGYLCLEMTGLTSVTIPSNVFSFGDCSFSGCSGISTII